MDEKKENITPGYRFLDTILLFDNDSDMSRRVSEICRKTNVKLYQADCISSCSF